MFNALSDFLIYCRIERRLADLTCKAYERDVRACLEFLRDEGIAALAEIRTPDLRRFLAAEATHRPAPSSQSRTVAALRCFFCFCVESDYLERDPVHVLRTPKKREALPDVLDRGELARLLDVPGKRECGSGCTPARCSATVCCWPCSPMAGCAAQSCSASTSMTSISTAG
jgi:integrase/recombinase XerD